MMPTTCPCSIVKDTSLSAQNRSPSRFAGMDSPLSDTKPRPHSDSLGYPVVPMLNTSEVLLAETSNFDCLCHRNKQARFKCDERLSDG